MREYLVNILLCCTIHKMLAKTITFTKIVNTVKVVMKSHSHQVKRPSVKIARDVEGELKPPPTASTIPHFSPTKRSAGIKSEKSFGESEKTTPASAMSVTSASKIVQMKTSLQSIFEDYKIRTDTERTIGRKLSLERTMSFYEQFHAYIAWQDECASEEDGYGSVMDNLYQFFGDRYIKDEAKFAAVHDFLSAVVSYSRTHRVGFIS
ncbi:hypothetical protein EB796_021653 [Bugula neritina]|uniref:Uncharacterized protein n=1 Tax=Bugula neritina TaxID=10212 RepID=A0A7J7J1L1_BUGNE|nr:hypothetical protein EB796_021653 [Bugula neritina]